MEFTKDEASREFPLGAYADLKVGHPNDRDWNVIPPAEKPLIRVEQPPFTRDYWTQVAFTWDNYNPGQPTGVTRRYLDGQPQGERLPRVQTFTRDVDQSFIMLGFADTGWIDDLTIFDREWTAPEIARRHGLPQEVSSLWKP